VTARGPVWGAESEDLNATILEWPPDDGPPEHVNEERDVLVVCLAGSARLLLDGTERELCAGDATIVPKGTRRLIVAGGEGVRYLTAHRRRGGLQIKRPG
jgi:quercetin dioxygenase-like cupin family protein